jgi:arylformamidase
MSEIIDISLPITAGMPVYPGMAETKITRVESTSGTSVSSEISFTSHTGTHIDAPNHVSGGNNQAINDLALDKFYGSCRVLNVTACDGSVKVDALEPHNIQAGERILLKTKNSLRGFDVFYDDYVYLDGEAAEYLTTVGVTVVGIDALSIKQRGSSDTRPHTALLSQGIPIIEGLNLANAEQGSYTLAAFPLAFQGIDGSPIRAVLITD